MTGLCDGLGLASSPLLSWDSNHEVQRVLLLLTFHFMLPILDSSKTAFQKFHLVTSEVRVHISVHTRAAEHYDTLSNTTWLLHRSYQQIQVQGQPWCTYQKLTLPASCSQHDFQSRLPIISSNFVYCCRASGQSKKEPRCAQHCTKMLN